MRLGIFRSVSIGLLFGFSIEAYGLPSFRCYSRIGRTFNEFYLNDGTLKMDFSGVEGSTKCELKSEGLSCSVFSEVTGQHAEQAIDLYSNALSVAIDKRATGAMRSDASVSCYSANNYDQAPKAMSCSVTQNGRYVGMFPKRSDPLETSTQMLLPNGSYLTCFQDLCGITHRDPTTSGNPSFSIGYQNNVKMVIKSGAEVSTIQCDATQLDHRTAAVQTNPIAAESQQIPIASLDFAIVDARIDGDFLTVQGNGRNSYNLKTGEMVRTGPYLSADDIFLGDKDGASYVLKIDNPFGTDVRRIYIATHNIKENHTVFSSMIASTVDPSRSINAAFGGEAVFIWTETGGYLVSTKTGEVTVLPVLPLLMGRHGTTVVYANGGFVVWGGFNGAKEPLNTGALFSPETKTWTAISVANAPSARGGAYGFWNGKNLIIYGGFIGEAMPQSIRTSGFYDFSQQTWAPINLVGSPVRSAIGDLPGKSSQKCSSNKSVRFDGRYISEIVFDFPSLKSSLYLFDTIENKWLQTKSLPASVGLSRASGCPIYNIPGIVVADPHFASVAFSNLNGVNKPTLIRTPTGR